MATTTVTKVDVKKAASKAGKAAKKGLKTAGKAAVNNPKTTLYVVGGLVALYVGYKIYKSLNSAFEGSNIDNQVPHTGGNTTGATISNQVAANYAQQLLDAMNAKEPFYGTDEDTVEAVFDALSNGADFLKVYNAFGLKDYNGHNSPPSGFWAYLDSYEKRNLVYWLKSEISPTSDARLYNKVKQRVESAGFTF